VSSTNNVVPSANIPHAARPWHSSLVDRQPAGHIAHEQLRSASNGPRTNSSCETAPRPWIRVFVVLLTSPSRAVHFPSKFCPRHMRQQWGANKLTAKYGESLRLSFPVPPFPQLLRVHRLAFAPPRAVRASFELLPCRYERAALVMLDAVGAPQSDERQLQHPCTKTSHQSSSRTKPGSVS